MQATKHWACLHMKMRGLPVPDTMERNRRRHGRLGNTWTQEHVQAALIVMRDPNGRLAIDHGDGANRAHPNTGGGRC
jgi:hypothetical protein